MRLGLAAVLLLLVIALGGYTVFWFVAAGRVEDGVAEWARSLPAQKLDLSWRAIRVGGFPLGFAVELSDVRLRHTGAAPRVDELRLPLLAGRARPWNFRQWQLTAPQGLSASDGRAGAPNATLNAAAATGSVALEADGGAKIWLALDKPDAEFGVRLAARDAEFWLDLPSHAPQQHTEPALGIALAARQLLLPSVPAPLMNPLDEISLGVTLKGAITAAPPRRAAALWRDAGGTLELDHFALRWGSLRVRGSGTLALDAELQPEGAFSGGIEGYNELMTALVGAGRMRAGDAQLARLALTMFAKSGPDGRPEIAASFTIQNGQMFLGPAKLGPVPRINWE
jgi:hypothetical protein